MRAHDTLKASRRRETNLAAGIFVLPAFAFIAVFIAYPIYDSMRLSTMQWSGFARVEPVFVGLSNWAALARDSVFRHALSNNLRIVVLSILIQLPIGVGLGLLLDTGGKRLNALKIAYFVPYLVSSVAIGLLFRYAFDPYFGVTKFIMSLFGRGSIDLLGHPSRALFAVIGVICWQYTPFYMVYFLAGFSSMPTDVYEAAIIDGASRARYFFHVALPLLKPTIKNACILSLVGSLKYFDLIYVMTGGGPVYSIGSTTYGATELMATYMYKNAFVTNQLGYGSTVAMAMFVIVTLISSAMLFFMNRREEIA